MKKILAAVIAQLFALCMWAQTQSITVTMADGSQTVYENVDSLTLSKVAPSGAVYYYPVSHAIHSNGNSTLLLINDVTGIHVNGGVDRNTLPVTGQADAYIRPFDQDTTSVAYGRVLLHSISKEKPEGKIKLTLDLPYASFRGAGSPMQKEIAPNWEYHDYDHCYS